MNTVKVNFRFSEAMRKRLDNLALKTGLPIADVVRKAVDAWDPDAISIVPTEKDRGRISGFCGALGVSPAFLMRCALMEYLDSIDKHGFRTSILVSPEQKRELFYKPDPAPQPEFPTYKMSHEEEQAHDVFLHAQPSAIIAAGTPRIVAEVAEDLHPPASALPKKPVRYVVNKPIKSKKA